MTCSSVLSSRAGYRTSSGSMHPPTSSCLAARATSEPGTMSELTHPVLTSSDLPSVSVVVPVRNERPRISDLLAAIEAQTLLPREVLLAIGGYDPTLHANEDFEVDHRLREAGGTIWLDPQARATWYTRETAAALARQMWRYGFFNARK